MTTPTSKFSRYSPDSINNLLKNSGLIKIKQETANGKKALERV
jgi:hypothetical protein